MKLEEGGSRKKTATQKQFRTEGILDINDDDETGLDSTKVPTEYSIHNEKLKGKKLLL